MVIFFVPFYKSIIISSYLIYFYGTTEPEVFATQNDPLLSVLFWGKLADPPLKAYPIQLLLTKLITSYVKG